MTPIDRSTTDDTVRKSTLVKWGDHVLKRAVVEATHHTLATVARQPAEREQRENWRADRRNLNRMLMLMGALVIGLVVTFVLSHPAILGSLGVPESTVHTLAPYAFIITLTLDAGLALYAFVKKY